MEQKNTGTGILKGLIKSVSQFLHGLLGNFGQTSLSFGSLICKIRTISSSHTAVGNITEDNPSAILENYASLSWSSFPHHGCPFPLPCSLPTLTIAPLRVFLSPLFLLYARPVCGLLPAIPLITFPTG